MQQLLLVLAVSECLIIRRKRGVISSGPSFEALNSDQIATQTKAEARFKQASPSLKERGVCGALR